VCIETEAAGLIRRSLSPSPLGSDFAGALVVRWLSVSLMLLAGLLLGGSGVIQPALASVFWSDRLSGRAGTYGETRSAVQPLSRHAAATSPEVAVPAYDLEVAPRHTEGSPDGPGAEGSRTYLRTARLRL
jgi:hypothetical protein